MIANYHTHTSRCGHATGEDREYVEKAIELGLSELGITEHAPMPFPVDLPEENLTRLLNMRMKMHETDGYFESFLSLREEYKNDIKLHIGFEVEYFECCFDSFIDYIKDYPVDYIILGQHFGNPYSDSVVYFGSRTNSNEVLKNYVDLVIKGLETGKFTYLAHPDVIKFEGEREVYEREMTRLVRFTKEKDIPIEVNLLGIAAGRHYPNEDFWKIASENKSRVIIGTDAHSPNAFLRKDAIKKAEELIARNTGLELIQKVDFKPIK